LSNHNAFWQFDSGRHEEGAQENREKTSKPKRRPAPDFSQTALANVERIIGAS
jgi:hypothetical protein